MTVESMAGIGRAGGTGGGWRCDPDAVAPTVLILGGFMTVPPQYRGLSRRLLAEGAAGVVVSQVWAPDWLIAVRRGCGAIATRSGKALREAGLLSNEVSGGAPVLVVGHSAGGLLARILTAPEPLPGRRFGAAGRIGAIVTLGTPHRLANGRGIGRSLRGMLYSVAEESVPGACFAPRVGYVSVASRSIRSGPGSLGRARLADLLYRSLIGRAAKPGTEGDGFVPVEAAALPGAGHVLLDGALHGPSSGTWYGSPAALRVWWPIALEAWHEALRVRLEAGVEAEVAQPREAAGVGAH